jgi:hypothetical protein
MALFTRIDTPMPICVAAEEDWVSSASVALCLGDALLPAALPSDSKLKSW